MWKVSYQRVSRIHSDKEKQRTMWIKGKKKTIYETNYQILFKLFINLFKVIGIYVEWQMPLRLPYLQNVLSYGIKHLVILPELKVVSSILYLPWWVGNQLFQKKQSFILQNNHLWLFLYQSYYSVSHDWLYWYLIKRASFPWKFNLYSGVLLFIFQSLY